MYQPWLRIQASRQATKCSKAWEPQIFGRCAVVDEVDAMGVAWNDVTQKPSIFIYFHWQTWQGTIQCLEASYFQEAVNGAMVPGDGCLCSLPLGQELNLVGIVSGGATMPEICLGRWNEPRNTPFQNYQHTQKIMNICTYQSIYLPQYHSNSLCQVPGYLVSSRCN